MRFAHAAIAAFLIGGAAGWFWPAQAQPQQPMPGQQMQGMPQQHMPMDTPVPIGSAHAVCTGVGQGAENDPRWASFPIRLEFSNKGAQYLSGVHLDLSTASLSGLRHVAVPTGRRYREHHVHDAVVRSKARRSSISAGSESVSNPLTQLHPAAV
jgi:hypothetical protein